MKTNGGDGILFMRNNVMNLPQRKINRLKYYDYNQNGAYFITICTKERRPILSEIVGDDAHIVPKEIGKIIEKYIRNVPEIKKYVIMPDHIHLLIQMENGTMKASSPTMEHSIMPCRGGCPHPPAGLVRNDGIGTMRASSPTDQHSIEPCRGGCPHPPAGSVQNGGIGTMNNPSTASGPPPFRQGRQSSPTNKIASIVRSLKGLTTKEIGESIFQRSYYDHVIRNEQDYYEIWEYIENNPKSWALKHM